jgi:hypothetical protein
MDDKQLQKAEETGEVPEEQKKAYEAAFGRPWYPGAERFVEPSEWIPVKE